MSKLCAICNSPVDESEFSACSRLNRKTREPEYACFKCVHPDPPDGVLFSITRKEIEKRWPHMIPPGN